MQAFLTTEQAGSPLVHSGPCILAIRCIWWNGLTHNILSALVQTHIIDTVFKVFCWVHFGMAVTEWPFRVSQNTTEIFFFILDFLSNVTTRTDSLTAMDTSGDFCHSPAGAKLYWGDRYVTIPWNKVILVLAIVVATQPTNGSHVITRQCHKQRAFPVKDDFEAKGGGDHRIPARLVYRYLLFMQGVGQVLQLIIYLAKNSKFYIYRDWLLRKD